MGDGKSKTSGGKSERVSTQALLNSIETPEKFKNLNFEPILKELGIIEAEDPFKSVEAILAALGYKPSDDAKSAEAGVDVE